MRIGFDAKRLYNNFTGLGNYSRFVVDALLKFYPGNAYSLFTPKIKYNPETQPFLEAQNATTVLPSQWIQKMKLGSLWRAFAIGSHADKKGIELYHGLSHELPHDIPKSMKAVVTVHDLIFLRYPKFYNPIDVSIYKAKVKHACRVSDKIISISEQTAQDLVDLLGVDKRKIQVVYQGCHSNFKRQFTPEQISAIRIKYNLPAHFILNVGTIEPRKNVLLIIKALRILKNKIDIPLVIIGRPTAYMKTVDEYARRHGLENRIIYFHKIQFDDLPALYHLADVFVYPSLYEGFGIPLIEAITCKIPVITSTGSCFSEAAGPASLYVHPGDDEMLANHLLDVLENESLKKKMIAQSSLYIQKFQPEIIARDLHYVYSSLMMS